MHICTTFHTKGGLLEQAVEISNFFLPKGSKILATKGKVKQWDKEYIATKITGVLISPVAMAASPMMRADTRLHSTLNTLVSRFDVFLRNSTADDVIYELSLIHI